jgi:DNA-binding NarL/FixJ family response regulator
MSEPTSPAPAVLRVLVVDSDDRIRESLTRLLPIGGRCAVIGSAGHTDSALDIAASMMPDVVVVDSRIPELPANGSFFARLRSVAPDVRIIVLNWSDSGANGSTPPGADAYIRKTFRPQELIEAVVTAARRTVA